MSAPPAILEGARLRLRKTTSADTQEIFGIASDPEVTYFMDWPTQHDVSEMRARCTGYHVRWESGEEYHWVIEALDSGQILGCISCRVRDHEADFGFFLARHAWGRGMATEAARLVVDWLKGQPFIQHIWATTDFENARSARVLEKVGLVRERVLPKATVRPNMSDDSPRDVLQYAWERGTT